MGINFKRKLKKKKANTSVFLHTYLTHKMTFFFKIERGGGGKGHALLVIL